MSNFLKKAVVAATLLGSSQALLAGEAHYIDVRTAEEYAAGHVSVAVNIPHGDIAGRISEITEDKDAQIYVYCRSGNRSGQAQKVLQEMGFTQVENLGSLQEAREFASKNASSSLIFD